MRVLVVGTGYVGLVQGAGLAEAGHDVVCMDKDAARVKALRAGQVPFFEPGLEELVLRNVDADRLRFVEAMPETLRDAMAKAEVAFLCVGTPSLPDGGADLSQVLAAATSVRAAWTAAGYDVGTTARAPLIVVKSTVPPGTTAGPVAEAVKPMPVASNPEFLKEGDALRDFFHPDRIVIGASTPENAELLQELYLPFVRTGAPVLKMDPTSAELAKYANNAMLATRVSLMNELAYVADTVGADIEHVRQAIGADKRIGPSFLFPGVGWGGSCWPKDLRALARLKAVHWGPEGLFDAVLAANLNAQDAFLDKVLHHFRISWEDGRLDGKRIAVWGLAFKPGTDDMREAPSIRVVKELLRRGASVRVHDPKAMDIAARIFEGRVSLCDYAPDAAVEADALLLLTEWPEYRGIRLSALAEVMRPNPALFDGRNVFAPDIARAAGFTYYGVGRR